MARFLGFLTRDPSSSSLQHCDDSQLIAFVLLRVVSLVLLRVGQFANILLFLPWVPFSWRSLFSFPLKIRHKLAKLHVVIKTNVLVSS